MTECAARFDAAVLVLTSFFAGSLAGFSGLIREPCVLLVGETLFSFSLVEGFHSLCSMVWLRRETTEVVRDTGFDVLLYNSLRTKSETELRILLEVPRPPLTIHLIR